jgi:response regulator RpfG family c-di-GMP phosphodiesterase
MLIIHLDPNRLYAGTLKRILEKLPNIKHRLFEAREDATQFVCEQLREGSLISLIITDYSPARINGYKFADDVKRLAAQSGITGIPVLLLTMVSDEHPVIKAGLENGYFTAYLNRSADASVIYNQVKTLLDKNRDQHYPDAQPYNF